MKWCIEHYPVQKYNIVATESDVIPDRLVANL